MSHHVRRSLRMLRRLVGSVRVRVAVVAGLAFAVTMVAASVVLLRALESRLVDSIRDADSTALHDQGVRLLSDGPAGLAAGGGIQIDGGQTFVFRVSQPGQQSIVATAAEALVQGQATERPPDAPGGQTPSDQITTELTPTFLESFDGSVSGSVEYSSASAVPIDQRSADLLGINVASGPILVSSVQLYPGLSLYTASSLAQVNDTLSTTRTILWYAVPALVLLVAGFAWLLVGRALKPVHALTSRAATITSRSLHERVPVADNGDEVSELATTINSMLDRIETADIASRRLVSDASHELRTPIAVMRTELEVARRDPDASWTTVSANVLGEVDRLQTLVDDLLLVARMTERGGATFATFSLLDTVRDVAGRRRNIDVPIGPDQVDIEVFGDNDAVRSALDHVVANAARHAVDRIDVTIESLGSPPDGSIAIHVDDDGPGIPVGDRVRVLKRFERLDEARNRDAGGSGLGLSVAVDVMTAHGGRVDIGDSPLGGARVSLLLRRSPPDATMP